MFTLWLFTDKFANPLAEGGKVAVSEIILIDCSMLFGKGNQRKGMCLQSSCSHCLGYTCVSGFHGGLVGRLQKCRREPLMWIQRPSSDPQLSQCLLVIFKRYYIKVSSLHNLLSFPLSEGKLGSLKGLTMWNKKIHLSSWQQCQLPP